MSCLNNKNLNKKLNKSPDKTLGYTLLETLLGLLILSLIFSFSLMGLNQWKAHEHLKQDLKNTHLALEFANTEAHLGQTVFICPKKNQLLIIQDSNKNNIPDSEDSVLKIINLSSPNTQFSLKAFGEHNQWISLNSHLIFSQNFTQNFTLELIQNNKKLNQGFRVNTLGDIQAMD